MCVDDPRIDDPPLVRALPPDSRYRDLCVSGGGAGPQSFDTISGSIKSPPAIAINDSGSSNDEAYEYEDYEESEYKYDDGVPEALSPFHEKYVGRASGSKPPGGACMAIKDTNLVDIADFTSNSAFGYFMNLDDREFGAAYESSNYYRDITHFIGGVLGCRNILEFDRKTENGFEPKFLRKNFEEFAKLSYLKASYCYDYYILHRSKNPWFVLERPGISTDDPLTIYDPDRSYLSNCQPLIRGDAANYVKYKSKTQKEANEKAFGFAPVLRYHDAPHWDEAEYRLTPYLQASWNASFDTDKRPGTFVFPFEEDIWPRNELKKLKKEQREKNKYPPISLPCIKDREIVPKNECGTLAKPKNPAQQTKPTPFPKNKIEHGNDNDWFNPNPSGQASGGDPCVNPAGSGGGSGGGGNGGGSSGGGSSSSSGGCSWKYPERFSNYQSPKVVEPFYCPNVEKIVDPAHPYSPRFDITENGYPTDRGWSAETVKQVPLISSNCSQTVQGYVGKKDHEFTDKGEKFTVPNVMCGVVPVDILSFRNDAFSACISQRISYNYDQWIKMGQPDMKDDDRDQGELPWYKCKTRYWETDSYGECPVQMSIQQCCRIIVKDLVPANFLKLRTCEGKAQKIREDAELQGLLAGKKGPPPLSCGLIDEENSGSSSGGSGGGTSITTTLTTSTTSTPVTASVTMPIANTDIGDDIIGLDKYFNAQRIHDRMKEISCDNSEPKDYRFDTHFGDHMPYMRWWDTGVSAGNLYHGGSFVNTLGMNDTLIGVGREERDEEDAKRAEEQANMCGAGNSSSRVSSEQKSQMGRMGGWTELKAHQMYTTRRYNMACLGRYEKLFKHGGPENFVLAKGGAGYTSKDNKQWPWPLGWRGYASASKDSDKFPFAFGGNRRAAGKGLDNALPGDIITYKLNGIKHIAYVTDIGWPIEFNRSKAWFDFSIGKFREGGPNGRVMIPNRVYVMTWDQGKFPTSTGVSMAWGMGPERTIYKERVPYSYSAEIMGKTFSALTETKESGYDGQCRNSLKPDKAQLLDGTCQPSCEDPDYSACILPPDLEGGEDVTVGNGGGSSGGSGGGNGGGSGGGSGGGNGGKNTYPLGWNAVEIYRPSVDVRECQGQITGAPPPRTFSLPKTYRYIPPISRVNMIPPDPEILFQWQTQMVDTNLWSSCISNGADAPVHYGGEYKGPQTGAITDNTICGPKWGTCSAAASSSEFFPRGYRVYK